MTEAIMRKGIGNCSFRVERNRTVLQRDLKDLTSTSREWRFKSRPVNRLIQFYFFTLPPPRSPTPAGRDVPQRRGAVPSALRVVVGGQRPREVRLCEPAPPEPTPGRGHPSATSGAGGSRKTPPRPDKTPLQRLPGALMHDGKCKRPNFKREPLGL